MTNGNNTNYEKLVFSYIDKFKFLLFPEKMVIEKTKRNYMYLNLYNLMRMGLDALEVDTIIENDAIWGNIKSYIEKLALLKVVKNIESEELLVFPGFEESDKTVVSAYKIKGKLYKEYKLPLKIRYIFLL